MSAIDTTSLDITKPIASVQVGSTWQHPTTQSVRDNFSVIKTALNAAKSEIESLSAGAGSASSHIAASTGVHGVSGAVVGTTDIQGISNKTITASSFDSGGLTASASLVKAVNVNATLFTGGLKTGGLTASASLVKAVNIVTTGAAITSKGATLTPAANTLTIDSTGDYYTVAAGSFNNIATSGGSSATGTRTATGIAREITLEFEGAGTITAAAALRLPGADASGTAYGSNITTHPGLVLRFREESANNWRCIGGISLPIKGVTDGSSAAAGIAGEVIRAQVLQSGAISLALTANVYNICSITLTAGDWQISGAVHFMPTGNNTDVLGGVSKTSATYGSLSTTRGTPNAGEYTFYRNTPSGAYNDIPQIIPAYQYNFSGANVTLYLVARADFSSGAVTACGYIEARRMR